MSGCTRALSGKIHIGSRKNLVVSEWQDISRLGLDVFNPLRTDIGQLKIICKDCNCDAVSVELIGQMEKRRKVAAKHLDERSGDI